MTNPPAVKYHAEGSGRDTYIVHGSGGLINEYGHFKPVDASFKAGLRDYAQIKNGQYKQQHSAVDIEQYLGWYTPKTQHVFANRKILSSPPGKLLAASRPHPINGRCIIFSAVKSHITMRCTEV